MNRIRLLPEQVANQIAAGEVIERPASIVKELVENALDAHATRISVDIQGGGRQLVRVTDDGVGMSRDDALLCLERHATSKIRLAEDLAAVTTMGFRGEALPSIASVSRFSLTTREREATAPDATQVLVQGGRIVEVRSAGHAPGTTVEVRQLFFNLPARRKFLRSEDTERAHVIHYLTLAALANPEVGFTLRQDDRLVWQLPPMPSGGQLATAVRERLHTLLGREVSLLSVEHQGQLEAVMDTTSAELGPVEDAAVPVRLWGYLGAPGVSRATREDQYLFVNRRPVENRGLNFALLEGYHTALMKGRYPVCCLFLELDPSEVDVNVHPAKREVKFRREQAVRRIVAAAVRDTLLAFHRATTAPAPASRPQPTPAEAAAAPPVPLPVEQNLDLPIPSPTAPPVRPRPVPPPTSTPLPSAPPEVTPATPPDTRPPAAWTSGPGTCSPPTPPTPAVPAVPAVLPGGPVPLLQVPLRLIGVVGRLYVLYESDRGLVLMDQHAAHERVLFEQMLERLQRGAAPSQRLLLAETVELSARDALFVRENLEVLVRLGVGLSEFGERTFLLDALPPFVRVHDGRRFVLDLVDELQAAGREVNSLRLGEHVVAKTVCRHAVKANDPLAVPELGQLLEDLRACTMPYTCPHGRPTLIEMSYKELEKKFGRIQ